jgi:murein L,D-transpeptidase YafK
MRILLTGCVLTALSLPALAGPQTIPSPSAKSQNETSDTLPASLLQISETEAFSRYVFLVDKEKRKLSVFERNGEQIKKVDEYPDRSFRNTI